MMGTEPGKGVCIFWDWSSHFKGTYRPFSKQGSQLRKTEMRQVTF